MFIILFEDGNIYRTNEIIEEYYQNAKDGIIDIINITDSNNPLLYTDKGYIELEKLG